MSFEMILDTTNEDYDLRTYIVTAGLLDHPNIEHRHIQEVSVGQYDLNLKTDSYSGITLMNWIYFAVAVLILVLFCCCGCYCCIRCRASTRKPTRRNNTITKQVIIERKKKNLETSTTKPTKTTTTNKNGKNDESKKIPDDVIIVASVPTTSKISNSSPKDPVQEPSKPEDEMHDIELNDNNSAIEDNVPKKKKGGWFSGGNPFNNGKRSRSIFNSTKTKY